MFSLVRSKLTWLPTIAVLLVLFLVAATSLATPMAFGQEVEPEDILNSRIPTQAQGGQAGSPSEGVAQGMEIIGHNDLGGRGFNADVWVHEHAGGQIVAYVGQWGFGDSTHSDRCPSPPKSGVRVLDVTDPTNPEVIATLQNPPQTTAEDVEVVRYSRGPFRGRDIALVGIQACFRLNPDTRRGLQLFDVTNPANPVEVGFLDTGVFARGVHEFTTVVRRDGIFAILAVPFSQIRDAAGRGDVRIADITNPATPVEIADFHFVRDAGLPGSLEGFGCFPFNFAHGANVNEAGDMAFVSSFDLGTVILDISDPANPTFVGKTPYPANVEGDAHSADLSVDEGFLFQADEVIPPNSNCQAPDRHTEKSWGYVRVFNISDPASPVQVAAYRTPNSMSPNRMRKGDYSAHNPLVVGNKLWTSWYSDGVRVSDISDPTNPVEIAFVVPPAFKDPLHVLGFVPEVWGIVVDARGCGFASDMNGGLFVVREVGNTTCR